MSSSYQHTSSSSRTFHLKWTFHLKLFGFTGTTFAFPIPQKKCPFQIVIIPPCSLLESRWFRQGGENRQHRDRCIGADCSCNACVTYFRDGAEHRSGFVDWGDKGERKGRNKIRLLSQCCSVDLLARCWEQTFCCASPLDASACSVRLDL